MIWAFALNVAVGMKHIFQYNYDVFICSLHVLCMANK